MKKYIAISVVSLVFTGCGVDVKNLISQPSFTQQKIDAQNAWDELEGKEILLPKSVNSLNSAKKIDISNKINFKESNSIPNWFYSVPQSKKYFYGAGEGRNINEAKNSALNYIASEIQTTISSQFSKIASYSRGSVSNSFYESAKEKIDSEVAKINFTNIEIVETIKVGESIYILLRVNKQELFRNLKTEFELLDSEIDTNIKAIKNFSSLEKLITLNKLTPKIKEAINKAIILSVLNPNFNVQTYIKKYNSYLQEKIKLYHSVTFNIESNNIFAQKLVEVMNQNGYKIGYSDLKIVVKPNIKYSTVYGMIIARGDINIQIMVRNRVIKSTSIQVKGISTTKYQALLKASIDFKDKLENINQLLGFE